MNTVISSINFCLRFVPEFRTTTKVVREVMGVPMVAVETIAHQQGIELTDGACIDENALSAYADAYVHRMRAYFTRAKVNLHQMGTDEILLFYNFCETFKKPGQDTESLSWSSINQNAIREHFIQEVKQKTLHNTFDTFADLIFENLTVSSIKKERRHSIAIPSAILNKVTRSIYYLSRAKKTHIYHCPICDQVHEVLHAARYHIYRSDDEHHHSAVCSRDVIGRLCDYITNSTLMMVVSV